MWRRGGAPPVAHREISTHRKYQTRAGNSAYTDKLGILVYKKIAYIPMSEYPGFVARYSTCQNKKQNKETKHNASLPTLQRKICKKFVQFPLWPK
jgi:hypothetical protein